MGWAGTEGITRVGQMMLARLMKSQISSLPGPAWAGLSKVTTAFASTAVREKAAPPALTLKLNNSVSPYMSLAPFELLSYAGAQSK